MAKSGVPGIREMKGKWQYRFTADGKRYSVITGLEATKRNLAAATAQMQEHKKRIQRGRKLSGEVAFTDAADRFLEWSKHEHAAKPNTWKRQRISLVSLRTFFTGRRIREVTPGEMESYKTARRESEIAEVTIRHDLHAASQLFQFARKQGWLDHDPLENVAYPSDQDSRNEVTVSDEEERLYLEHAADYPVLYDFALLMLNQGFRPDEVLALLKEDVDLEAGTARVRIGKSRAARRTLHLTPASKVILGRRMPGESIWIFPGRTPGTHFSYSGLVKLHNAVLAAAKLSFTMYSFRHTFATRLCERTRNVAMVAKVLGHADLKTVMRYVHISDEQAKAAMVEFEAGKPKVEEVVQ